MRLIKIDVEGAEWGVLAGLIPAFAELPNDVELIIEIDPQRLAFQDRFPSDIISLLAAEGFHSYYLQNDYNPAEYIKPTNAFGIAKRFAGEITSETLLVFSKQDAEELR